MKMTPEQGRQQQLLCPAYRPVEPGNSAEFPEKRRVPISHAITRGHWLSSGQDLAAAHQRVPPDYATVSEAFLCTIPAASIMLVSAWRNSMRRITLLFAVPLICLLASRADALTFRDVIELTHAGLGEDVLLALIDVDRSVFPIDAASIKRLKEEGVSERVILAMVRSGREVPPSQDQVPVDSPAPSAPAPQVVVIDHPAPAVREVPAAVPVYIPVAVRPSHGCRVRVHVRAPLRGEP